ncbi:pyridoxamine 5'-phosphate oxidase family protein [Microbacterium sp. X-17]|uniref:pyridoxamine 5'-phosphate oxidase family protein n=1 Tax=Microbacterium sp. X-17 TaxID=3144404 RepID=UPI0031F5A17A
MTHTTRMVSTRHLRPPTPLALTASAVERLTRERCWDLLATEHVGRLAVIRPDGGPDVFVMDYLVGEQALFLRSGPGAKLVDVTHDPRIAFEVDGREDGFQWSVVLRGVANRMNRDDEIEASGVLDLQTTSPTNKFNYVRITPSAVTGCRFRPQR